jgi:uncharacterized membrane protein YraQ (UPF0718 family)
MFTWTQHFTDWLVYNVFQIASTSHWAEALNFFIYDSIKIIILLFVIIFLMGIVNSYFPVEKVRNFLSRKKLYGTEYLMACLFGVVTPFCSCSSVPLFIGFVKGGIPLGVTFAFLVTSPLVNEVAIGMFLGMFGVKITIIYVVSGILLGMTSGFILQKMKLEPLLTPWVKDVLAQALREQNAFESEKTPLKDRLPFIWEEVKKILKGIIPYVLIGIAIGGLMHGFVPDGFFEKYMHRDNPFAIPMATLLAVPLYANAAGILPIVQVLVAKGIPIGTAIAFMMAVVGLSFPEAMLLKKVMTVKLIALFFGVVTLCIMFLGYFFNWVL